MNVKRYLLSALALFAFMFVYEWIVNGFFLKPFYDETAGVWRNMNDMYAKMPLALTFQLALAFWAAFAFAHYYRHGGIKNGLQFGLFFGFFAALLTAYWYVWLPVPDKLGWSWFFSGLGEWLGAGMLLGSIYHD